MINLIKNLFKLAKILSVDDSGDLRFAIVSALGKKQKVQMFTPYGLMSNPPEKSMVLLWSQQGQESNGIGMADDPKNRILKGLKSGEVALGNYLTTDHLVFLDGNLVEVNVGNKLTVNSPNVEVNAEATVVNSDTVDVNTITATVTATAKIDLVAPAVNIIAPAVNINSTTLKHNGTNIGDDHFHDQPNDSGDDTEEPTGGPQ